jgi:ribosome biogenesis GTPase A
MQLLHRRYPQALLDRYGIEAEPETPGYELLEMAGKKRGFLMARGEINTERMAGVLLEEFRSGKLGKFTLEEPENG